MQQLCERKKKKVYLKHRERAVLGKKGKEMQQPCERKKKKVCLKQRECAVLGKKGKERKVEICSDKNILSIWDIFCKEKKVEICSD